MSRDHLLSRIAAAPLVGAFILLFALVLPPGGSLAQATEPAHPAGKITFAMGAAEILAADGSPRAARPDGAVYEGDRLSTGADGWLHLRMRDDAFVAMRPNSTLRISQYVYDPARPQDSRIRLDLDGGNARTVSGRGGEMAPQHYRFGTPLAAIGLRGTDYSVRVFDDITRVSVRRGAVSVTPLGEGCSVAGAGPCDTTFTRELTAQMPHAYIELSARNQVPSIILPEQDVQGAAAQNPPLAPAEPDAKSDASPAPIGTVGEVVADQVLAAGAVPSVPSPPPAALVWGRWSSWVSGDDAAAVAGLLTGDREVMVGNDVFGLLRSNTASIALPTQGAVSFRLANSEAYVLSGGSLAPAQVRDGSFGVDFRQRTFDTTLVVQHAGGRESLQAAGAVQFQGFLIADPARSNMNLQGALSRDGAEAAYLFDKPISAGDLLGAVRWLR